MFGHLSQTRLSLSSTNKRILGSLSQPIYQSDFLMLWKGTLTFLFAVVILDIFVVMGERGSRLRRFEGKRKKIYRVSLKKHSSEVSGSGLFWKIRDRFGLLRPKVQCSVLKISSWIVLESELICNCFCLCKAWTVRLNYLRQIAKINYNIKLDLN